MTAINKQLLELSEDVYANPDLQPNRLCQRWHRLCEQYLPVKFEDSIWRHSCKSKHREPLQGWKLHISATILDACDLFERVASFLSSENVQFKAPKSLDDLSGLNCGLQNGYHQVGKFITIYPDSEAHALCLAARLHELTKDFFPVLIPFDEQYAPDSSVFYRYGGFSIIEGKDEDGNTFPAIKNPADELVLDDRLKAVPEWLSNPFPNAGKPSEKTFEGTPLGTTYKIFSAITQRGKGGTYEAIDINGGQPRLCIVKEGRRNGEIAWNGQDGYALVENEFNVLKILKMQYAPVPQVFDSFEIYGNFYFAMEYVEGKSLHEILQPRQRRFSILQVLNFALEISRIIENIHQSGWVWNDCKPANLIVGLDKSLRPIDFEGAYPIGETDPFDWKTRGFSKSHQNSGTAVDIYALGAVIYFLLTGRLYDMEEIIAIKKLRRNVPSKLIEITEKLLSESGLNIFEVKNELQEILAELNKNVEIRTK
ncbi:MAG TPA: hypothetical protein PKE69_00335 [Pyrinomonadaceae bacterium]|nr:hypothetical protein [Pyrinomonadaceae bacterium]